MMGEAVILTRFACLAGPLGTVCLPLEPGEEAAGVGLACSSTAMRLGRTHL
ncbi:hypothetical protein Thimo_0428 [Thioflavicoccus mobilis 8321]|uniref:Uncharacterized protein n=1 Tax=Thioflavicoccus mobilis 8321 TaxID=765912 RepID=L0GVG2_9GAMM|nr:hypothetical protein Thimo_0428 [Thioflavicoccus mobilis 8321]